MKLFRELGKKPWANTAIAACIAILFYVLITHLYLFGRAFSEIYRWIRPVFLGLVMAYILNPLVKWFEKMLFGKIENQEMRRSLATAVTVISVILVIVLLMVLLIPQLVDSIRTFVSNIGGYSHSLQGLLRELDQQLQGSHINISEQIGRVEEILGSVASLITSNMDDIGNLASSIGTSVADGVLSFIVAIYFMAAKNRIKTFIKKILHYILSEAKYERIAKYWRSCNEIFVHFIAVDLMDGLIVGVTNCLFMLICGIPYSVLISVIVGLTNLAPTFGPIAGALIGSFILLLVNPWYALWFLIFTLILQTLDGYVLKPKIFSGTFGVPSIWILITLIVGGRIFGVPGILLAIPFAAIILFTCQEFFPDVFPRVETTKKEKPAEQRNWKSLIRKLRLPFGKE